MSSGYDLIEVGDTVTVYFENVERITGTVRNKSTNVGECWVIENDDDVHFVNSFARITKSKR